MNSVRAICAVRTVPATYERYRYVLHLRLSDAPGAHHLAVLMKNPSTAMAERLDPTIGKVRAWARQYGFDLVTVVNLFALRATQPPALNAYPYEAIVGPQNDRHIREAAARADVVALGWGNPNGLAPDRYARRVAEVLALLARYPLHVVGPLTQLGHPRHGLLWNGGMALARWNGAGTSTASSEAPAGRVRGTVTVVGYRSVAQPQARSSDPR